MKCHNCGAPIQMNQKFCPDCGSPNIEFKKHIDDMERYDKKFNNTRSKVIGNSKWFVRYIAPVTALVISVIALAFVIIGSNTMIGYDIGRKNAQKYYRQHSSEVQSHLKELLDNGDYAMLYMLDRDAECSLTDSSDKYAWNDFYNMAGSYCDLRKGIISMMEKDNDTYYSNEYLNAIARAAGIAEDSFRIKGRMKGYEEEKLYYDFINYDYAGLIEKTEYNIGIGRTIDDGTKDYYLFADAYKKAIDYNVCVNSGNTDKAEKLLKDINSVHFDNVIFEEALENVKQNYIEKGLTE